MMGDVAKGLKNFKKGMSEEESAEHRRLTADPVPAQPAPPPAVPAPPAAAAPEPTAEPDRNQA
jgi:Sec-independent protein translocase protein TatA